MKKLILASAALFWVLGAHAAPVNGFYDVEDNGGGSCTLVFDSVAADMGGNTDGCFSPIARL